MLSHKFYEKKTFWIIKEKRRYILLKFNISKFRITEILNREKDKISLNRIYLSEILFNIFKSLIFIIALYSLEKLSENYYYKHFEEFPEKIKLLIDSLPKPSYPDSGDSVTQFISMLASISGVLLALFYPILATIASTGYAKVNASIRDLIFIEPVTQNYLRQLAFLTSYSMFTLLMVTFGYLPGNLILTILVYLGVKSLFSLLKLGAGVYSLFEPDTLSKIVNKEITKDIKSVTISGVYWDNNNFQEYFRKKVEKNIVKIRLINELSFEGVEINNISFSNTVTYTYNLLNYYLAQKNKIPVKSKWFKNKTVHKSFFETDTSGRQLSLNTKSYVQHKFDTNYYWFEEELFEIFNVIGKKLILNNNQSIKEDYLSKSITTLEYFGYTFEYTLTNKLLSENLFVTKNSITNNEIKSYQNSKSNLILAETFIYSIGRFQQIFFNRAEQLNVRFFNNEIEKIDWKKRETIYESNLPTHLHSFLEKYISYIENEISIEGKKITPNWYIIQHITAEYLILLEHVFFDVIKQIEEHIFPLIKKSNSYKDSLLTSFICHLTLELINKFKYRIPQILKIIEEFDQNNLYKGNFNWKNINEENANERISIIHEKLVDEISQNIQKTYDVKWDEDYPDIFARSYSIISEELLDSLNNKDLKKFNKLYKTFLESSIGSFFSLHNRYSGKYINEFEIIYQIHIELFQISGISYIYTELTGIPFWQTVIDNWEELNITKEQIKIFIASYTFYKMKFGIGHNYTENSNRKNRLFDFINNNNINTATFNQNIIYNYINDINSRKNEYEEIFIELYLFSFIDSKEFALSLNRERLRGFFDIITRLYNN